MMAFDFPSSPTTGQTYSVTGGPTYVYNGTAWVVLTPGNQFNRTVFTATAGQTTFTMNYVVGAIDVYRNGVKLAPADFTATNGTSIVLANGCTVGDTIEVISYPMITYSDAVKRTGDTMTGNLTVPAVVMQTPFAMRNRIINGAMMIDQRNSGAAVTANGAFPVDRFFYAATQASKATLQQNAGGVTPPQGFTKYFGVTSSSAYAVLASDYFNVRQVIEGFNISDFNYGTADAKTITLSFWVRSSLTGNFGGVLAWGGSSANQRSYPFLYTITGANTWEYKTVTVPGDTTMAAGGFETSNGAGMQVRFSLGGGATNAGTPGSWATVNAQTASGDTSVVGTNGATWYLTGVQLEVGSVATPFERRLYPQELAMCQRYYYRRTSSASVGDIIATMQAFSTGGVYGKLFDLPVELRADGGTVGISSPSHLAPANFGGTRQAAFSAATTLTANKRSVGVYGGLNGSSGLTAGYASVTEFTTTSGWIDVSVEL